jgi:hypothetical protein
LISASEILFLRPDSSSYPRTCARHAHACLLALLIVGNGECVTAQTRPATAAEIEVVVAELLASNAEWQRNDRDYRRQRDQGRLSGSEAAEFAQFVAGLRHRMLADCERVRDLGGDPSELAIDCGEVDSRTDGSAGIVALPEGGPALTEEEKSASLDNELREIEADLDELLATRQNELSVIRRSPSSSVSASGGRSAGRRNGDRNGGQSGGQNSAGGGAAAGDGKRGGESGEMANARNAETSAGTGGSSAGEPGAGPGSAKSGAPRSARRGSGKWDGVDDDILARQLREAAESEPDPVLKDKLWEEYRKYKESTR